MRHRQSLPWAKLLLKATQKGVRRAIHNLAKSEWCFAFILRLKLSGKTPLVKCLRGDEGLEAIKVGGEADKKKLALSRKIIRQSVTQTAK